MTDRSRVVYEIWTMRITLATTLIVVVLSWLNSMRISDIIIRGGVSFGIMYFLLVAIRSLFEKSASLRPQNEQQSSLDAGRGGVIDFSVGDNELSPEIPSESFAGQVDPSLSKGLPGSQQQAEIVRRMGWGDESK